MQNSQKSSIIGNQKVKNHVNGLNFFEIQKLSIPSLRCPHPDTKKCIAEIIKRTYYRTQNAFSWIMSPKLNNADGSSALSCSPKNCIDIGDGHI